MIGTSPEFQQIVRAAHVHVARVDVLRDGAVIMSLPIHSGSVEADRAGRILRRFDCVVADFDGSLTPEGVRSELAPFGTELRLYRGVRVPIVVKLVQVTDTEAEWDAGTRSNTVGDSNGDLVLGNV